MKYLVYTLLFFIVFAIAFGLFACLTLAQGGAGNGNGDGGGGADPAQGITLQNPAGSDTIAELIHNITSGLVTIATPIVAIMVLIGAFQILFAAGDPEKFKLGKKTILYTIIGYAIILVASGITSIIKNLLSSSGN
jgi:hypothetical protein